MTKRFWAVLAALGLPLLAAVWFLTRPLSPQMVTLPDGRTLALEAVTFGTQHHFVSSPVLWQRLAGPWLPASWARRLDILVLSHRNERPSLMVWIHLRGPSATPSAIQGASLMDEQGHELAPVYLRLEAFPEPCHAIAAWEFVHLPRRARRLRVRFYYPGGAGAPRVAAEFLVRNPAWRRYAVWQPEASPIKKTRGDLEFALVDLFAGGVGADSVNRNIPFLFEPLNTALFRVARAGRLTTDWRIRALELDDATGNHLTLRPDACSTVGEFLVADFRALLWPSESCWKLTAEFVRIADFQTNEVTLFARVGIPPPGGQVFLNQRQSVQGVAVRVLEFKWAQQQGVGFAWLPRWNAEVVALLEPAAPGLHLGLAGVSDQRGRELRWAWAYQAPNGQHHFQLEIPEPSTALDLRFAVQRTQLVEFLVRPTARQTNH